MLQKKKMPPKCKDPSMLSIPCKIGHSRIEKAILDLDASTNVMPCSIYNSLKVDSLKETGVVIQLADESNAYPNRVLEDILVQVDSWIFFCRFLCVECE